MAFKSGFIAIVGRPNAGKSTLVNALVGRKVAIVSPKPQTTRNRIQGIVNRDDAQIVLIDTPGIHKAENALSRQMMDEVTHAFEGIDVLTLLVDAATGISAGDKFSFELLRRFKGPVFLALNKIDQVKKPVLLPLIDHYQHEFEFAEVFPISALTREGTPELLKGWLAHLPEAPPYFPADQFTDQPERFLAAEIIREKAILVTREEVPYAIAVLLDSFDETDTLIRIRATLYVEREGQKGILIGKRGDTMKKIGTEARKELESILGIKIFLELFVKVQPQWRQNPNIVRQLDWHRQLEQMSEIQQQESSASESAEPSAEEPETRRRDQLAGFRWRNPQRAHLAIQMASFQAQRLGGLGHVPPVFFQFSQNELAFVRGTRLLQALIWLHRTSRRAAEQFRRQMVRLDLRRRAHDHQSLHQILQLTHVSRPRIAEQHFHGCRAELLRLLPVLRAKCVQEMRRQNRNVLGALPQRRHIEGNHVQPVKEVLAKGIALNFLFEFLIRGGQHAHIHIHRLIRSQRARRAALPARAAPSIASSCSCRRSRRETACRHWLSETFRLCLRWLR